MAGRRKGAAQGAREALYRDLVLDAAEGSFAEKGIDATKMEEIAELAGLSLGTVYAVFRGKPAIVDALHERRLRDLLQRSTVSAQAVEGTLDRLVAGVRAYVEYFLAHPDTLRIHLSEGTSWGLPIVGRSPRAAAWEEGHAMQERLFRRGIDEGIFYPDEPGRMANTLAAMQQVRLAEWLAGGMTEDPEEIISGMELQLRRAFCVRPEDRGDAPSRETPSRSRRRSAARRS